VVASGPCEDWPVIWPCSLDTASPPVSGTALRIATQVVWAVSGRQFGYCDVTLRPCRRECLDVRWAFGEAVTSPTGGGGPWPYLYAGRWYNLTCGGCGGECSCPALSEVVLPSPVDRVDLVMLDGSPMPTGSYAVHDQRLLVRTDGSTWPTCQDLARPDTEPDTWSVSLRVGRDVPELGQLAVGEVACEVLRALKGEDCRLPARVTQLARQGVSITLPDVGDGLLGLPWTDRFITSYNPGKNARRARVYRVDDPGARTVT
jgi:hypothetical protein